MNIFADRHHHDLYYSLSLLFEKRFGWNLYCPIGIDWHSEGYWRYSNQGDTVKQFLGLDQTFEPEDGTPALNQIEKVLEGEVFLIKDTVHNGFEKAVTLDGFKKIDFDIIIASVPQHYESFNKLIQDHKPNAKLIQHFGNILWNFNEIPLPSKNIMASIAYQPVPDGYNAVFYHQEFDISVYSPAKNIPKKQITSFVNCLPHQFPEDFSVFNELKALLPEFDFKSYGGSCPDGSLGVDRQIAHEMQESMFGFHCKKLGDGYGHVIHNWFAVGKPVIVRGSDYKGKLAGELLTDGETCIDIEKHSYPEIAEMIREWSKPDIYEQKCANVYRRFEKIVDFEAETVKIKEFLENLK